MSSSSIEVMSGNDVEMVLMDTSDKSSKADIHTLEAADPVQSYILQNPEETVEPQDETEDLENLTPMDPLDPPPGSIIFSPQDMMATSRFKQGRYRGRGRAKGIRRSDALTIKIEEGVDYSKIILPVACEICGKIVANGKTLVQHMTTHSDIKPYQCPHCMKSFARMVHLQGHLVLHGIEKQFECPICHQRFSRQDCVKVHMRLHDKSKCVFCDVCHKAFLTLGALNIHMRIHRGEKPFKCHLCGKCFTQKNHVITHIKRHTKVSNAPYSKKLGPRMFQCEHCPRSFIRLSDYERHVQWNHGAVADTASLSEKLGIIDSFSDMDKDIDSSFSPLSGTTLNTKVKKKSIRKVMCTIGTQTDQEGGHVIIPRQYQSASSMIETSTQVSAPPTPRPTDEDMYENDIFDEGMDRNFSSDEEYDEQNSNQEQVAYQESETTTTYFQEGGTDSAKDDAFDAVLGKPKPEPSKNVEKMLDSTEDSEYNSESNIRVEDDDEIQTDLGSEYSKREEIETELIANLSKEKIESSNKNFDSESTTKTTPMDSSKQSSVTSVTGEKITTKPVYPFKKAISNASHKFAVPPPPNTPRIVENFNTKNWKGRLGAPRGRGRGRGKNKNIMGLTGATHLRLIRKSMINFITEKTEQMSSPEKTNENNTEDQFENAESPDRRAKRQAKTKQHGKDFICSVKSCEICNPISFNSYSSQEVVKDKENDEATQSASSSETTTKDQSQKLLQFLLSGDESNLQGTDFRLISDVKEIQLDSKRFKMDDVSSFKTQEEYENSKILKSTSSATLKLDKPDYFIPVSKSSDYASPPVELQAFCIPTYSCKLCGREFRFEGKLHRHIESVHQHKPIFSPDVKPGRGSTREVDRELLQSLLTKRVEKSLEQPIVKKSVPRNPEIEALRSEWDDDDDDDEVDDEEEVTASARNGSSEDMVSNVTEQNSPNTFSALLKQSQPAGPIITREIVAVRDTLTHSYAGGVKVNINKISGLAGSDFEFSKRRYEISSPSVSEVIPDKKEKLVHTLDTKCRKLLEKLFDHSLLIESGLFNEHVSVVLGRILQHYGVKMIEDYGQGQYEVLKYNLWRLIEWKVTMEQMEEFYTEGKSVEEMMDDIMNGRVPIIAHHEPQAEQHQQVHQQHSEVPQTQSNENHIQTVEAVQLTENQLMLSQVANVLGGQLNLGDGVTQVVLAQDVSPEMLQGAHIVTIDPTTGQVLSQVTAEQVILTDSLTEDISQIQSIDGTQVVPHTASVVSNLPPGSIVAATPVAAQQAGIVTTSINSDHIVSTGGTLIKIETSTHSS